MKRKLRRYFGILLSLILLVTMVPAVGYAAETDGQQPGVEAPAGAEGDQKEETGADQTEDSGEDKKDDAEEPAPAPQPTGTFLAFTADVHNDTVANESISATRMYHWLDNVSKKVGTSFENLGVCGGLASGSLYDDAFWKAAQEVVDVVKRSEAVSGEGIYVPGDHEWDNGNFANTKNATAKLLKTVGQAADTKDYAIYAFGASSDSANTGFMTEDIEALKTYLSTASQRKPIFIMSHFPLHTYNNRTTKNAAEVISVLNEAAKDHEIIFLWGHNHTYSEDPAYDKIEKTRIDATPIQFTYASAGCMSDSELSGKGQGSDLINGKGLIARIEGTKVTLSYYAEDYNLVASDVANDTTPPIIPMTSITLNIESFNLTEGKTFQLAATIAPENTTFKELTWTSSDEKIATVSETGLITAVGGGLATITVTNMDESVKASCEVNVIPLPAVNVESVSLDKTNLELTVGETAQLKATITPDNATNKEVKWSVSNEEIATVTEEGKVTAVAAGSAAVIVSTVDGGKIASCVVTVKEVEVIEPTPDDQGGQTPSNPDDQGGQTPSNPDDQGGQTPSNPDDQGGQTPSTPDDQGGQTPSNPDDQGGQVPSNPDDQGGDTPEQPIVKVANTITASNMTVYYNTKAKTYTVKASALEGAALSFAHNSSKLSIDKKTGKIKVKAGYMGSFTVTITAAETEHYLKTSKKITFKVAPNKTSFTSAKNNKGKKLYLKWKKINEATDYQIQYSTDKNFKKSVKSKTITSRSKVSATYTGLTKGKTYYVRIRSYKTISGSKKYAGWSAVKKVKITK